MRHTDDKPVLEARIACDDVATRGGNHVEVAALLDGVHDQRLTHLERGLVEAWEKVTNLLSNGIMQAGAVIHAGIEDRPVRAGHLVREKQAAIWLEQNESGLQLVECSPSFRWRNRCRVSHLSRPNVVPLQN